MQIARRYTQEGQSPYAGIPFRATNSEIRNPDGSVVFALEGIEVPAAWSQVASDVLAQKYFRKAGVPARLKRIEENAVPSFLWRSEPDEAALAALPKAERYVSEISAQPSVRPPRRNLDLLGLEGRLSSMRRPTRRRSSTNCATCWRSRSPRPIRRNGSTPASTGPMASTARARAIIYVDPQTQGARQVADGL